MKIEAIIRRSFLKNTGSEATPYFDIYMLYFLVLYSCLYLASYIDRTGDRLTGIFIRIIGQEFKLDGVNQG